MLVYSPLVVLSSWLTLCRVVSKVYVSAFTILCIAAVVNERDAYLERTSVLLTPS